MMKYADHHGFPIVTFVDTPGAFADLKSEELGQVCGCTLCRLQRCPCLMIIFGLNLSISAMIHNPGIMSGPNQLPAG